MLVINCIPATGAQILSILLGVIVFNTVPIPVYITTNHIAIFEYGNSCENNISALINTIKAIKIILSY